MKLVNAHVYPTGTYILAKDRRETLHGIFCWSAEQIALTALDWRFSPKDERQLAKLFMQELIDIRSPLEPQLIHGIGAGLIEDQFVLLKNVREITKPGTTVLLPQGHVYYRAQSAISHVQDAALFFYITSEGQATLAHVCTQDHAAEILMWEDWIQDSERKIIEHTIRTLPAHDPFNQHPTFIRGDLVTQLIMAQMVYKQFFPEDSTARN